MVTRADRNKSERPKRGNGKLAPFTWVDSDLEYCKLLAHDFHVRKPWSYETLPTSYFPPLLQRGTGGGTTKRLQQLCWDRYLRKTPNQPTYYSRQLLYSIGDSGAKQIYGDAVYRQTFNNQLPHKVLQNLFPASFEIGMHKGLIQIAPDSVAPLEHTYPDWPIFQIETNHHKLHVLLEADLDNEPKRRIKSVGTSIDKKIDHYCALIKDGTLKHSIVLFATINPGSTRDFIKLFQDMFRDDQEMAKHFAVMDIDFRIDLSRLPEPTAWAIEHDWHRADKTCPFNFLKEETW